MRKWCRRPLPWPTICTVPTLAVLIGLGMWQLERFEWKRGLIDQRAAALTASPIDFNDQQLAEIDFVKVRILGRFRHADEIHLVAPPRRGRSGYHIVTPFESARSSTLILVDRGWVPKDLKQPDTRRAGQVSGEQIVVGFARRPPPPGWFTPNNQPEGNVWYWVDIETIAQQRVIDLQRVIVEADATPNPGGHPIGGQTRFALTNNHLGYAITWFGLAVGLIAIYIAFHRRNRNRVDESVS